MGKKCENQSANADSGVFISGGALDKLINLFERSVDLQEKAYDENEEHKAVTFGENIEFIKNEIKKVEKEMVKTDIHSDEYRELVRTYDRLLSAIRFI